MAAPLGNKNATKNKPWSEALNRALVQEDGKKLRALADKLIEKAMEGDVPALKEIADRLEGKPAQTLQGPDGSNLFQPVVDAASLLRDKIRS